MVRVRTYELDHWVLFDTLNRDQISRLKNIIDTKTQPALTRQEIASGASVTAGAPSFQSMLSAESEKLSNR